MKKSSSRGVNLTTVLIAVFVMTVSAVLSNTSVANDMDVKIEKSE
tara:strand:+ start:1598 stop:1732 length:135 start_codon:yes stop_codon:yes gene_type:complete